MKDIFGERDSLRIQVAQSAEEIARQRTLVEELRRERSSRQTWVPPGHYYSPIASVDDIVTNEGQIWRQPMPQRSLAGVSLREVEQMRLFRSLVPFYHDIPFHPQPDPKLRYFFENTNFSYSDAIFFYCMIRHLNPRQIIEIGSGYSSCVMLDTNEMFFGGAIDCTFVEPHPDLLFTLLRPGEQEKIRLINKKVQDVGMQLFAELDANDILFIDSSHVSKTASDVNHLMFNVLPQLRPGVYVHFHDIFYPFVYPRDWELEGRAWNETYLVRAFLQYNDSFDVVLFNTFLECFHYEEIIRDMPLCAKSLGGSLWLQRRK